MHAARSSSYTRSNSRYTLRPVESDPANLPVVFAPGMKLGEPQAGVKQLLVKKLPIEYNLNEPIVPTTLRMVHRVSRERQLARPCNQHKKKNINKIFIYSRYQNMIQNF